MKNQTRNRIISLVFIALYAAMAIALEQVSKLIPFLQMSQGGSIELGIIPIFMASYHLGFKKGLATSLIWWLLGFLLGGNNRFVSVPQYLLDYIVPLFICSLASAMPKIGKISNIYTGVVITMFLKFMSHVLSGVYYWFPKGSTAGSAAAWTYSLGYNAWYNLATTIVAIIIVPLIIRSVSHSHKNLFAGVKE